MLAKGKGAPFSSETIPEIVCPKIEVDEIVKKREINRFFIKDKVFQKRKPALKIISSSVVSRIILRPKSCSFHLELLKKKAYIAFAMLTFFSFAQDKNNFDLTTILYLTPH